MVVSFVVYVSVWIRRSVQRCWCSRLCFIWIARLCKWVLVWSFVWDGDIDEGGFERLDTGLKRLEIAEGGGAEASTAVGILCECGIVN